ncbi:MAG TPA: hypothetical protein VFA66_11950 [Gaiellaceae bacterium]|nr:hypothetical protein [Gaiellaceae bacterium]
MNAAEARRRRAELVPQLRLYGRLDRVFWPILTATAAPGFTSAVVNTDSRGHRLTRLGDETARSDAAPEGAGFLLGGSYAFGVGASDDAGTLAAALWRRTGTPYVNLGIRAATSAQELVSALPFADRETTFVVCSGLNNFATAEGDPGLDPLFGPMHHQAQLGVLTRVSIATLARLVREPHASRTDAELRAELRRRRRRRLRPYLRPVRRFHKRVRGRLRGGTPPSARAETAAPPGPRAAAELIAAAAARQLRDLGLLRRVVPERATVLFALQPLAPRTGKQPTAEEKELFALLDVLQPERWPRLRALLDSQWGSYAALLERGCRDLGVPFADLSRGDYSGWCFVDRVHMTDHGHDQAAALLEEVIRGAR